MDASVIIPVFNDGLRLKNCLEALCTQKTEHTFEVLVVDDASEEDIVAATRLFAGRIPLKYIRLEKNSGPGAARNAGVAEAKGNILLFTDSDCVPAPDWLEKMLQPFNDPRVTGVKGVYASLQNDLWARLAQLEFEERYEKLGSYEDIDFIDTYSAAFRKVAFAAAGGFSAELRQNEDVDLAFRMKKAGAKFVFAPDAGVIHTHREGWLAYARLKYQRGFWRMLIYRQHPEKAGRDTYTPFSLKMQLLLVVALPFMLASKTARFIWKSCWLASCLPLVRVALPERPLLAPVVPVFCLVRGFALLVGMISGFLTLLKDKDHRE